MRSRGVVHMAVLALAAIGLVPAAASAQAPTIHVATSGSDANPGTSAAPVATITRGLQLATGGERVVVRAGTYPRFSDRKARTSRVTLVADGVVRAAGAVLQGAQQLSITGVRFTGGVEVAQHPNNKGRQPATGIELREVEVTNPGGTCVKIRSAFGVLVEGSYLHDCRSGITGPGDVEPSRRITVRRNLLERFNVDAMQFGSWSDVVIESNIMREITDPAGWHNDVVQLTGDVAGLVLRGNWLMDSEHQLLLVQDATGPIDRVLIENNLMVGSGAYAVQLQGATRTVFRGNTVWESRYGGLLLRNGYHGLRTTDTVVVNNVLSGFAVYGTVTTARYAGNFEHCDPKDSASAADLQARRCGPRPGFIDERARNYRLHSNAVARAAAVNGGPVLDILGVARPTRSVGAYA